MWFRPSFSRIPARKSESNEGPAPSDIGVHSPLSRLGWSVRIVLCAMLAFPLGFGCGGEGEEKPAVESETGDDGGSDADCTAVDMALQQAEAVAPSVVRISFKLTCDGESVPGKTEEDFTISEDGASISVFESSQQIVPTVASFQLSSVLVLDMSGSMVESGNLPGLQDAANSFISTVGGQQNIAIYTFDGRAEIEPLVPFTQDVDSLLAGIDSLSSFEAVDSSTNLNGAVVASIAVLDAEAALHTDKLFGGTIAIFTDGKDQAGRVSDEAAEMAAGATDYAMYSIGLGGEIDTDHLDAIGKDGAFYSGDIEELSESFAAVATDILNDANSLYVLAYCSPKRAGEHELRVALNDTEASITQGFNAEGFEAGCDPTDFVPPEFLDLDEDGFRPYDGDCNDEDASQYPGATEECDEVDNNCDGEVDEGLSITIFRDSDGDGYGRSTGMLTACELYDGYVTNDDDCDDSTALRAPGLDELCDDIDHNCDGSEEADAVDTVTFYRDWDGDGYGDAGDSIIACSSDDSYVPNDDDCEDASSATSPAAIEVCDGEDNDCDGTADDGVCGTVAEYTADHGGMMIMVDAQTFEMGCTAGMSSCDSDELPVHDVTLTNDFYIGETEVTQGEYESMMGTNPSHFGSCGSDCPVEMMTWHMAAAFANAVSESEGLEQCYTCTGSGDSTNCNISTDPYSCGGYRLPTEAEWEAAARCGEDTLHAGSTEIGDVAWYADNAGSTTHAVATKASNVCGLYDMSGNVWEWIQEWYDDSYYSISPSIDPVGSSSGVFRVVRGGSFLDSALSARVADRYRDRPLLDYSHNGLRLARTSP